MVNVIPQVLLDSWYRCGLRLVTWSRMQRAGPVDSLRRVRRRHWILRILTSGRSTLHLPSGQLSLLAPVMVLIPPDQQFVEVGATVAGRFDMVCFDFETLTLPGHVDPLRLLAMPARVSFGPDDAAARLVDEIEPYSADDVAARLRTRALLHRLLVEFLIVGFAGGDLTCQPGRPPRWLADARLLAARRFGDPDLDLTTIAAIAGVTPQALGRAFRRFYGQPVMAWLRCERIHNACTMLRNDDEVAIGEVARGCGYRSRSLFARHFHAVTGLAARDWRRMVTGRPGD